MSASIPSGPSARPRAHYRDLLKHSAVYGFGQVLTRLASVILLPVYTFYLRPADYGAIAILDVTGSLLGILIGGGMVAAAGRYHFDTDDAGQRGRVWWTALLLVVAAASALVGAALLARGPLAALTLGGETAGGVLFYSLMLPTVWLTAVSEVPDRYLRVQKWSWAAVAISLGALLLNIGLNIYFLAVMNLGVAGVLTGNLITNAVAACVRVGIMARTCPPVWPTRALSRELWRFGWPMVATALLAMFMHQADRYVLRAFLTLDQIGVYSLAHTIAQGLNALVLTPFAAIWSVVMYEIATQPDAKRIYARIFEYFVYGLVLVLFGVSLFIQPLLGLLVSPEYGPAAALVPIVCLGFVFFSVHAHFSVPAYLAKRSVSLIVVYASAAVANIVLNVLLVPRFGLPGAAWASVGGYVVFAGVALQRYRRIDRIDYPVTRCLLVVAGMAVSFVVSGYVAGLRSGALWTLMVPAVTWLAWVLALGYPMLRRERGWLPLAATL